MSAQVKPKIAIIGAGPAGAALARMLLLHDIPFTLFEGEASSSVRAQGSTLDLHPDTGLAALKQAQLWEEFQAKARYDGEAMVMADKHYRIYMQTEQGSAEDSLGRPEIDRSALRQLLVDSLPASAVCWNHRVREVHADGTLSFRSPGTEHEVAGPFDLIVGADGAWSHVRPLVSDVQPSYTGLGGIDISIEDPATTAPDLYAQVNRGSLFVFTDGKALQPQQLGSGPIHAYTWSRRPEDWQRTCGFDPARDTAAVRAHLDALYADWHPQLRKFIQAANGPTTPRNLYMLPVGLRWPHRRGFTLVGDAAHLMTPFAGEGVNLALADAMDLANAIKSALTANSPDVKAALDAAVATFEETMWARAHPVQQLTLDNMKNLFDEKEGHLEHAVLRILRDVPEEVKADLTRPMREGKYGP